MLSPLSQLPHILNQLHSGIIPYSEMLQFKCIVGRNTTTIKKWTISNHLKFSRALWGSSPHQWCVFCDFRFNLSFLEFMSMKPYSMYLFVLYSFLEHHGFGILPSQSVPIVRSFLLLMSILLCARTTVYLPSHHLIDIWVISSLGLFWIKLLWTSLYNLCVNISFLLGKGLCIELLSHMANVR